MDFSERLKALLNVYNLSASEFSDKIQVQRSSISHILSGRNKPSLDFMSKIKVAFPLLSWDWLILGEGTMYEKQETRNKQEVSNTQEILLFEEEKKENVIENESILEVDSSIKKEETTKEEIEIPQMSSTLTKKQDEIVKTLIFYADGTFEEFKPR